MEALERILSKPGVIMVVGAADTGKTTFARKLLDVIHGLEKTAAYVDAELAQSTVGPPACVGLKVFDRGTDTATIADADELRFVGSTSPDGVVLPHVVGTASLVDVARSRAEYVLLDTTSVVSGVVGQTLKYHTMELCRPSTVIAFQRGEEMNPIIGMLERFLSANTEVFGVDDSIVPMSPDERRAQRSVSFARELGGDLTDWRVAPTVFAPTLPAGFDEAKLSGMVVGVQDDSGRCLGLGALIHDGSSLRVRTRHGETMQGLRLGSLRIDLETFDTTRVRLRHLMFGF